MTGFEKTLRMGSERDSCNARFLVAQVKNCQSSYFAISMSKILSSVTVMYGA